jgi:hypothetical protein
LAVYFLQVKAFLLLLVVGLAVATPVARASSDDVRLVIGEASVSDLLKIYASLSGRKMVIPPELSEIKDQVHLARTVGPVPIALRAIENALLQQVSVKVEHLADGSDSAREIAASDSRPPKEAWSEMVDGIRGRLVIDHGPDFGGAEMTVVYLEIQNVSDSADAKNVCFDEDHQFKWQLVDERGELVRDEHGIAASIMVPGPYWIVLPYDSTLRFRVSVSGYGISPEGGVALQLPGAFWQVQRKREGAYFLSATFASVMAKEERRHAWKGVLVLPKVQLPPIAK